MGQEQRPTRDTTFRERVQQRGVQGRAIQQRPVYDTGSPLDELFQSLGKRVSRIPEQISAATTEPWRRLTTAPAKMLPSQYKTEGTMLEALAQGRAEPLSRAVSAITPQPLGATTETPSDYPRGWRSVGENAYDVQAAGEPGRSGGFMARRPGQGDTGPEWTAKQSQGAYQGVGEPMSQRPYRPTEELYKQAFRSPDETAPSAQASAGMELFGRVGPDPEQQMKMLDAQIPVRQQEVAGQYGLRQEGIKGEYGLRGKQIDLEGQQRGYDTLRDFIGAGGKRGLDPGASISVTGAGSYRAPTERPVPTGLLRDLIAAKTAWEGSESWTGSRDETLTSQYQQALGSVFAQDPSDPATQEMAKQIATDPELSSLPLQELMQDQSLGERLGWDLSDMADEDWEDLSRLLNYTRGAGF